MARPDRAALDLLAMSGQRQPAGHTARPGWLPCAAASGAFLVPAREWQDAPRERQVDPWWRRPRRGVVVAYAPAGPTGPTGAAGSVIPSSYSARV
jgi:hypothetical protein